MSAAKQTPAPEPEQVAKPNVKKQEDWNNDQWVAEVRINIDQSLLSNSVCSGQLRAVLTLGKFLRDYTAQLN